ncbi:MAG: quinone oxidoreductase [Hyphomicrobium aestuarii]|nr:quinone oxidoreductase [Hyphomicrobium aestuarii]
MSNAPVDQIQTVPVRTEATAVRIHAYGGPDVLVHETIPLARPAAGEVQIRQHACGINYIDVYQRTGSYKLPNLPAVIGMEGAGEVVEIGPGVTSLAVGDRVAYAMSPGGYASHRNIAADRLVPVPAAVSYETAAAAMLQGMTVRYLFRETYPVAAGTVMLFHAAAGGVGLIACQWARALGATLIGTVSTPEKAALAKAHGASHVVVTGHGGPFVEEVKALTGGRGCDVVYDSIGKDTFPGSLDCLRPKGMWVSFGSSSGPVPPFEVSELAYRGSLFATRPSLAHYIARREDLVANAADLFEMIAIGAVTIPVNQRYPLADAARAHRELEARQTTGSSVLIP